MPSVISRDSALTPSGGGMPRLAFCRITSHRSFIRFACFLENSPSCLGNTFAYSTTPTSTRGSSSVARCFSLLGCCPSIPGPMILAVAPWLDCSNLMGICAHICSPAIRCSSDPTDTPSAYPAVPSSRARESRASQPFPPFPSSTPSTKLFLWQSL